LIAVKKLGKAQRRAARRIGAYDPATRRKPTASNRWRRAPATVERRHATVAAGRADSGHQLTTRPAHQFDTTAVEDRHPAGMVRNRTLARSLADTRPGDAAPAPRRQDPLVRQHAAHRQPLVPKFEDPLRLPDGETHTVAGRTHRQLHHVRAVPGPGRQRRTQSWRPRAPRRPGVAGRRVRRARKQDVEPT
jgi:hypothetical protein